MDKPTTVNGMEIPDTYQRGSELAKGIHSAKGEEEFNKLVDDLGQSVLVPEKDWEAAKRVNLDLRQRLESSEAVLNSLALYLRENFAAEISRGEHEGMSLDQIVKRHLSTVVRSRDNTAGKGVS